MLKRTSFFACSCLMMLALGCGDDTAGVVDGSVDSGHAADGGGPIDSGSQTAKDASQADASGGDDAGAMDASTSDSGVATGPEGELRWANKANVNVSSSTPAIGADGTIYVGSQSNVTALNPDGTRKYLFTTESGWPPAAPAVRVFSAPAVAADGTVFVGTNTTRFFAIDADGGEKWFADPGPVVSAPALGKDGTVYVGTQQGFVRALDPDDGTEVWSAHTGNAAHSVVVLADGSLAVGTANGVVFISAAGKIGTTVGNKPVPKPIAVAEDGTIYAVTQTGNLYSIMPDKTMGWELQLTIMQPSAPVVGGDGTIYAGDSAVDPDGKLLWNAPSGHGWFAARADGTSVHRVGLKLDILSAKGAVEKSLDLEFVSHGAPTIAADGTIYTDNGSQGQLAAVWGSALLPAKGWPTVGGNAASDNRRR